MPQNESSSRDEQVNEAIAAYLQAVDRGEPPNCDKFLAEHADIAQELKSFFANQSQFRQAAKEESPQRDLGSTQTYVPRHTGPGTVIAGRYTLVEAIGEGGMGAVWVAKQTEPVKRKVALKLIKTGMDSKAVVQRFEQERQALALMDHPHIAKVLDGGITDEGRPFFVMELVNGLPLTKFCDGTKLSIRERLELFVPICQAVQHAHQKGIVHRDLKPSNILVTLYDGRAIPKVIDFGVAKATGGKLTNETMSTQFGAVVGTLEYMSPEQAGFSAADVDTRADIYSLGVILYELLTGTTPLDRKRLKEAALLELLRVIREEDSPKPSTRLSTTEELPSIAANRHMEPKKLSGLVRGELDWIVMKALEKDRNRRYETANGFAMDIQRYLADEPVLACPPSMGYRFGKFARRNKLSFFLAAATTLVLLLGLLGLAVSNVRIARERDRKEQALTQAQASEEKANDQKGIAEENARRADAEKQRAVEQRAAARNQEAAARKAEAFAKEQERLARRRLYAAQMVLAQKAWEADDPGRVIELLEGQRPTEGEEDLRGFEWYYLWRLCHRGRRLIGRLPGTSITSLALSPDGKLLVTAGERGDLLTLWDMTEGGPLGTLPQRSVWAVAFSPDGKTLASVNWTHQVTMWDLRTRMPQATLTLSSAGGTRCVAFSPDGKWLANGDTTGTVTLWDLAAARESASFRAHGKEVLNLTYSPDGQTLATTAAPWDEKSVRLWDVSAQPIRMTVELGKASADALAFSPDGMSLATAFDDGLVKLYGLPAGELQATYPGRNHTDNRSIAYSPDGKTVAFAGNSKYVSVWQPASDRTRDYAHGGTSCRVVFSSDGKTIVTGNDLGSVQSWEPEPPADDAIIQKENADVGVTISADGKSLAFVERGGVVHIWDLPAGRQRTVIRTGAELNKIAFSPIGTALVAGGKDGFTRIYDVADGGKETILQGHTKNVTWVAFSSDSARLMIVSDDTLIVHDFPSLGLRFRVQVPPGEREFECAAISPDGRTVVTRSGHGIIRVWNAETGSERLRFQTNGDYGNVIAFSPDGRQLAIGEGSGSLKLWDAATGTLLRAFRGHTGTLDSLAFFKDGQALVSCDTAGALHSLGRSNGPGTILTEGTPGPGQHCDRAGRLGFGCREFK